MASKIRIKRTVTPNAPPAALDPGELAIEMDTPTRLWVGVPVAQDPSGKKLLFDSAAVAAGASKAYVDAADALKANIASPTLTGTPAAPTPTVGDNSTKIATTAFVTAADTVVAAAAAAATALKANIASPTFTGTPSAPTAVVNTNTTQLATTAFVIAQQAAATGAAPFDALAYNGMQVNGSMDVSQESGTAVKAGNNYIVDGVYLQSIGTSLVVAGAQVADAPPGLTNSLKITVTTAKPSLAAGDLVVAIFNIEGYRMSRLAFGTASAQSVSIGFWTKIHRPGAYSASISNSGASRSYPFSFTQNVADVWEFKTVTIPGDVTGTWLVTNGIGLCLRIAMAAGATFVGTAGAWSASNLSGVTGTTNGVAAVTDVFQVSGLIVLPGIELPSAARSPFIMRPYDQELLTCKRYYQKIINPPGAGVGNGAANIFYWSFPLQASMRAAPTASLSGTLSFSSGGAVYSATAVSTNNCSSDVWNVILTASGIVPSVVAAAINNANAAIADARL